MRSARSCAARSDHISPRHCYATGAGRRAGRSRCLSCKARRAAPNVNAGHAPSGASLNSPPSLLGRDKWRPELESEPALESASEPEPKSAPQRPRERRHIDAPEVRQVGAISVSASAIWRRRPTADCCSRAPPVLNHLRAAAVALGPRLAAAARRMSIWVGAASRFCSCGLQCSHENRFSTPAAKPPAAVPPFAAPNNNKWRSARGALVGRSLATGRRARRGAHRPVVSEQWSAASNGRDPSGRPPNPERRDAIVGRRCVKRINLCSPLGL